MNSIESWFPTAAQAGSHYYRWRMTPWWPGEGKGCRRRSLLRLLALAHDQRLDLIPLLTNHADEQIGIHRMRIARLARRVADGTPIVEALEQTPEVLGDDAVLAIRFVVQTGTLSETYRDLIATLDPSSDLPQVKIQHSMIYTVCSLFVIGFVMAYLAVFIFPQLNQLREDLGFGQGAFAYGLLLSICIHIADTAPLYVLLVIAIAFLLWAVPSRRWIRRFIVPRWAGDLAKSRTSEVLRLLAIALQAGRPVPAALSTLAHYHFDTTMRHKLLMARNQIEQGADTWSSLADVRLLTEAEGRALAGSSTNESRVWALRRLAAWKRGQVLNQRDHAASLVQPAITIAIAAIVLLISSAIFGFLAFLIWSLA